MIAINYFPAPNNEIKQTLFEAINQLSFQTQAFFYRRLKCEWYSTLYLQFQTITFDVDFVYNKIYQRIILLNEEMQGIIEG